jgi:hypothetical protein
LDQLSALGLLPVLEWSTLFGGCFLANDNMQSEYTKILAVIESLDRDRILTHLNGNCVLAAEVIQNMLSAYGLVSHVTECQLMITHVDPNGARSVHMVGYDIGVPGPNQLDTHAVTVTQSDSPKLIDVSIGHLLDNPKHVIVTDLIDNDPEPDVIARAQAGRYELVYRKKRTIRLPALHQKNLVNRLQQEYQLLKSVRYLKYLVIFALVISGINATRGFYDFYNNYFSDSAAIGISATREILDRLDSIEQKLHRHE